MTHITLKTDSFIAIKTQTRLFKETVVLISLARMIAMERQPVLVTKLFDNGESSAYN